MLEILPRTCFDTYHPVGEKDMQAAKQLQTHLRRGGDAQKKAWWENYIKHDTHFIGLGLPQVERTLRQWYREANITAQPPQQQLKMAMYLLAQRYAEEKLAGVLLLQHYLCACLPWHMLLKAFMPLWDKRLIYDWSVGDWFCLRVLRQLLDRYSMPCAQQIAAWHTATYLWQARAALVPFVGRTQNREYRPLILASCDTLIRREERFAKTAVGWMMREFSKHELPLVRHFLRCNKEYLTREVVNNALKYYPEVRKKFLVQL